MKNILGIPGIPVREYAVVANAVLGIRDSGKTYTATKAAEELFEGGIPFLALDPIGVWHTLRIPGAGRGYPVVVAGGKHGDLPLTVKSVGEIVRAAMKANVSLVLDLFSSDLSKADWRRIVKETCEILLHENSDFGLRHVFIEEAAEFVPQRVTDGLTFSAVDKLVRMGGNSKVGVTLINQRSADLNKSVLELCANVFVHRQRGKNTLLDLKKWLSLTDPDTEKKITASLPDMPSGKCWVMGNDLKAPILVKVAAKNSRHPDRREAPPSTEAERRRRQPVPADAFVAAMKAALAPKAKPAQDSRPSSRGEKLNTESKVDARTEHAFASGLRQGRQEGWAEGWSAGTAAGYAHGLRRLRQDVQKLEPPFEGIAVPKVPQGTLSAPRAPEKASGPLKSMNQAKLVAHSGGGDASALKPPQRRVLASIGFWRSVGTEHPSRAQVAGVAGYSPSSGGFNNLLGQLNSAGLIAIPSSGRVSLASGAPFDGLSIEQARENVLSVLSNPQRKLVDAVIQDGGGPMSRDDLGAATDYSPTSGGFNNLIGHLCTLTIFEKPAAGQVHLSDWAREVFNQ